MPNISEEIYNDIRSWRALEAEKNGRPPFYIFKDEVIGNFLRKIDKIRCKQDILEKVDGIGKTLYEKYGDELWDILRPYLLKLGFIDHDIIKVPDSISTLSGESTETLEEASVYKKELYEKLKKLRNKLADEGKLPAYCIFKNNSLKEMATKWPTTNEQFLQIEGVGHNKLKTYGYYFMEVISTYLSKELVDQPDIYTEWSKEDLLYLKELLITEKSLEEIAQNMSKTEQTIRHKLMSILENYLIEHA